MKRMLIIAAFTLAAGYVLICALMFFAQRRLLYPAPHRPGSPPCTAGHPTVVYFHGNGACAAQTGWLALWLKERGAGFCAVEYPGYGDQPGVPDEQGIYAAAEAALRRLPRDELVLMGQSLGTGPAVEMAARGWGQRLILLSPFTSIPDAAQLAFPWLPARYLVRDRFDSASKAPRIELPVLVIHGDADEVVPYSLGHRLSGLFPHSELMTVPRGNHNDLWEQPGVQERIAAFLALKKQP
jgi:pimeloyl-ACP methyl ester carboxylesterase